MTRVRIAQILMARRPDAGRHAARALYPHEMRILAHVLDTSVEWLHGPDAQRAIVAWDPLSEPRRAQQVLQLIASHEARATERLSWAEYLPCSLETPDLMHAHHLGIFGDEPAAKPIVQLYATIGNGM
jgi:hypothetical protein